MLFFHLISKLWHLKLKAMASTLRLCQLQPWLWNRTLMSLLQSSLMQHPSVTVLNIWGKGRTGRRWSYEVHPINIFISVSISISRSWSQSLQLGLSIKLHHHHLGLGFNLCNLVWSLSIFLCFLFQVFVFDFR